MLLDCAHYKGTQVKNIARWAQQCDAYLSESGLRKVLALHFSICGAGLIVVSMFIAGQLGKVIHPPAYLYSNLFPWASAHVGVGSKTTSLLQYVLPVVMLFVYYPLYLLVSRIVVRAEVVFDKDRFPGMCAYFLALAAVNAGLLLVNKERTALIGLLSVLWLLLAVWLPLSILRGRWLAISMPKWLLAVLLCIIPIHYATIFVPLISNPIMIGNDYLNIPEATILKSGRTVDNLDFLNEHGMLEMQLHDPRKDSEAVQAEGREVVPLRPEINTPERHFSEEELDFLSRNEVGSKDREYKGWFLYHHGYNFGPMNALSLGASPDKQTMVYGWLSTVAQAKILESLGMMNYQGYFKEFFAEYLLYFVIFLSGIWLIFKRLDAVVFAGILAISALLELGIELIKLAPGFNPVRHIFDVPVFYLLYRYLALERKAYLFCACGLALFAVLWNKDFGLFLALSVGGAAMFKGVKRRPYQQVPLLVGGATAAVGMLLYLYPTPGANPTAIYMLMGVGSPQVKIEELFHLLTWIGVLLAATIWVKQSEAYKILTVGMGFYFVQSMTYYIWYPKAHHLLGIAPVFILWMVALYHGWISHIQEEKKISRRQLLVFAPLLLLYLAASVHFHKEQKSYYQTFKTHQLYHWPFENASFVSTMNPELFEGAANLVKRYSPNDKGIYIISKYDHILPILAGRYSAMPYNELLTNLVSAKEVDVAVKAILTDRPAVLFVDSDIGRSIDLDSPLQTNDNVIHLFDFFGSVVVREGEILSGLNKVYMGVAGQYALCVPGKLVSVYCRKAELIKEGARSE